MQPTPDGATRVLYRITDEYALVKITNSEVIYLEWRESGRARRRTTGCRELESAKRRARELILEHATILKAEPAEAEIRALIDRYFLRHARHLPSASTFKATGKLWAEFFGTDTVAELTRARQRQFRTWLEKRGYSQDYIRRVFGDGKAALNAAYQDDEITAVPFITLPPIGKPYPHWARRTELITLLNAPMPDHLFTYLMIRLNTGCRGDAARDLQPFMIDWESNLVALNPPGRQQTKKFRPVVPLTGFLRAYLTAQPAAEFYVAYRGKRVKSIRTAWRLMLERCGMRGDVIPKIFRHTVGTELRRRGLPGWDVSGQLGHTKGESAPTTETYAKFDPRYLSGVREAIDTWMAELAADVPRMQAFVVTPLQGAENPRLEIETARPEKAAPINHIRVVGGTGFEPVTPTMSRCGTPVKSGT